MTGSSNEFLNYGLVVWGAIGGTMHVAMWQQPHHRRLATWWQPHIRRRIEGNGADADTTDDTKPMADASDDTRTTTHEDAIDVD